MIRPLLCALALAAPGPEAAPAKLTLGEIIQGVEADEKAWRSQGSWSVRYVHSREKVDPPPGPAGMPYPDNHITNARKGPWLFAREDQAPGPGGLSPAVDGRQAWVLWKDGVYTERSGRDTRRMDGARATASPGNLALQTFLYPTALFRDFHSDTLDLPKDFFEEPSEASMVLPRCLKAKRSEYRVRDALEEVDGFPCHVVERAGRDVIWIDPTRGYNVRRRTAYWPSGTTCAEFKASDFAEKAPGVWLPARQLSVAFNPDTAPDARRGKVMFVLINRLEEARFGDVPDSLFNVPAAPGGADVDLRAKGPR